MFRCYLWSWRFQPIWRLLRKWICNAFCIHYKENNERMSFKNKKNCQKKRLYECFSLHFLFLEAGADPATLPCRTVLSCVNAVVLLLGCCQITARHEWELVHIQHFFEPAQFQSRHVRTPIIVVRLVVGCVFAFCEWSISNKTIRAILVFGLDSG